MHTYTYTRIYINIFIYQCDYFIRMVSYTNRESTCVPMYLHYTPGYYAQTHIRDRHNASYY